MSYNEYEINEFQQVVPYTSGRRCNDTRSWRDATELELQQEEELREVSAELAEATEAVRVLKGAVARAEARSRSLERLINIYRRSKGTDLEEAAFGILCSELPDDDDCSQD